MKRTRHSEEFKAQVLRKVRERGTRTLQDIADEVNITLSTLKWWIKSSAGSVGGGVPPWAPPPARATRRPSNGEPPNGSKRCMKAMR
jgi:transposase-like protein